MSYQYGFLLKTTPANSVSTVSSIQFCFPLVRSYINVAQKKNLANLTQSNFDLENLIELNRVFDSG